MDKMELRSSEFLDPVPDGRSIIQLCWVRSRIPSSEGFVCGVKNGPMPSHQQGDSLREVGK